MGTEKTAWHPPFTGLIQDFGPRWTRTSGELRLAAELRADDMIEVLADMVRDPNDRGSVLRGMWPLLVWVGLLELQEQVAALSSRRPQPPLRVRAHLARGARDGAGAAGRAVDVAGGGAQ